MTEPEFLDACDRVLSGIEDALDRSGADVESARSGNVLELEFDDGAKIIVNGNAPVREIWVAAKRGAFHFRHEAGRWVDTRGAGELFGLLSELASQHAGQPLTLSAVGPGRP
jgi:CyaY protein